MGGLLILGVLFFVAYGLITGSKDRPSAVHDPAGYKASLEGGAAGYILAAVLIWVLIILLSGK